jgi:hypothetical protein
MFIGIISVVFLTKWRFSRYRAGLQGKNGDGRQRSICARLEHFKYPGIREIEAVYFQGIKAVLGTASATELLSTLLQASPLTRGELTNTCYGMRHK